MQKISRAWARLARIDLVLLLSLLVVVSCVWTFFKLADAVTTRRAQHFDEKIMHALRDPADPSKAVGPRWLNGAMRDLTSLGSGPVMVLVVLAVGGALLARRQFHALVLLFVATLGGALLNRLLKDVFERERPSLAMRLTEVNSTSFPSGHAMDSAVIYLTLAALLARLVEPLALKLYFLGLAVLLTLLVGLTRVYLGVHYPSDVLAGWAAGLAWAVLCSTAASYLQRQGSVEPPK